MIQKQIVRFATNKQIKDIMMIEDVPSVSCQSYKSRARDAVTRLVCWMVVPSVCNTLLFRRLQLVFELLLLTKCLSSLFM